MDKKLDKKLFAKNLTYLRSKNELTQSQLADALGVSQVSVSQWEKGSKAPQNFGLLKQLSEIFRVSADDLLFLDLVNVEKCESINQNMLGKNIRYLRLKHNLSQDELAKELGYKSYTTIQKWETGVSEPSILILNKLAYTWHVRLEELITEDLEAKRYGSIQKDMSIVHLPSNDENQKSKQLTVYGKVCAGNGIEALENPIDEIGDPYYRIKEEKFALVVEGDSMNNVVNDGMYAIIEKRPIVSNGEIAVVLIDNEVGMLKRFYQLDDMVILRPDSSNPEHKPLTFIGEDINSLKILGRYLGCVSPMEKLL